MAGSFYPADPGELGAFVDRLLAEARPEIEPDRDIRALASPHAGYAYSGPVAAEAFSCLKGRQVDTAVLVGPDHYIGFEGIAAYPAGRFRTPLGEVEIDEELTGLFLESGTGVRAAPEAHAREHSLEVMIPFLQRVLPRARIVPLLMGFRSRTNVESMAHLLSRALDNPRVVLVASTDLSHYHPREVARKLDGRITELVRAFAPTSLWEDLREGRVEACGGDPLVSVMLGAGIAGAEAAKVLRYGDSGDATGEVRSVVGYLSAAFYRGMPPQKVEFEAHEVQVSPAESETLLRLAFAAAATSLRSPLPVMSVARFTAALRRPGRAFVTLRRGEELRGCIGTIEGRLPLWEAVARAARGAAHEDPRFAPVAPEEMEEITVEVSVLSPPRPVSDPTEIEVGRHGLIVTAGGRRGLLLPQVAPEHGWSREEFLAHACVKAGLRPDAWKQGASLEVFEATVFQAHPGKTARNGGA